LALPGSSIIEKLKGKTQKAKGKAGDVLTFDFCALTFAF